MKDGELVMKRILTIIMSVALILTGIVPAGYVFADDGNTPGRPSVSNKNTLKEVSITVSWNDVGAEKYDLQYSQDKTFKVKHGVKNIKGTSFKFNGAYFTNGRVYYFRVRAYKDGEWSDYGPVRAREVSTTTKIKLTESNVDNCVYYVNGRKFNGQKKFGGEYHYFVRGEFVAATKLMWSGVKNAKSRTKYLVITDCNNNRTYIYKGKKGDWKIYKRFKCTTGMGGKNATPKVNRYKPGGNKIKFGGYNNAATKSGPYTCWFASRFQGSCFYHSVIYHRDSQKRIMDGRLGVSKSHGCIRVPLTQALWMYRNIKKGTRIITFGNYIPSPR